MDNRSIICIDLKSFFASVECVYRGLDPFTTPLVVADISRGDGAMSLAASPYLRNIGIQSRSRVFEIKKIIPKNINIIYAKPRMRLYEEYSNKVYKIYEEFFSAEDIHAYSIDEVFIDATNYLKYYKKSSYSLALDIMNTIKQKTGITSTCGIGPNIFLAKVAMDTEAKHNKDCIALWTYNDIENKLWKINPLNKIWGFGNNTMNKLNNLGIYKVGDINNYTKNFYIKRFGNVMGNDIWCKANGIDFSTIKEYNNRKKDKSISMSQILYRDYTMEEAILIMKEMNDMLVNKLRSMDLTTKLVFLKINYSKEIYKSFKDTILLNNYEDNTDTIFNTLKYIYNNNIENYPIRKVTIAFSKLNKKGATQLSLFDQNISASNSLNEMINKITKKYGNIKLLRASSLLKSSTIKNREKFKNII